MKIFTTESGIDLSLKYFDKLDYNNRWFFDREALFLQVTKWFNYIPWIKPYYAVKSNSSPNILKLLSEFNKIGFDIASIKETENILQYTNNNLENTIYTNPHTIPHEIEYHRKFNQNIKVVDCLKEIEKLIEYKLNYPLLIRLKSGVDLANCKFDLKFGCDHRSISNN